IGLFLPRDKRYIPDVVMLEHPHEKPVDTEPESRRDKRHFLAHPHVPFILGFVDSMHDHRFSQVNRITMPFTRTDDLTEAQQHVGISRGLRLVIAECLIERHSEIIEMMDPYHLAHSLQEQLLALAGESPPLIAVSNGTVYVCYHAGSLIESQLL